eukprot:scaffold42491_cov30-Prasinocladus_malaysianus.AAC.1
MERDPDGVMAPRPPSARPNSAARRPLGALVPSTTAARQRPGTTDGAPSLSVIGRSMSTSSSSSQRPAAFRQQADCNERQREGVVLPPIRAAPGKADGEGAWAAPRAQQHPEASSVPSLPGLDRRFSARH